MTGATAIAVSYFVDLKNMLLEKAFEDLEKRIVRERLWCKNAREYSSKTSPYDV
jgi:hypothetical protein